MDTDQSLDLNNDGTQDGVMLDTNNDGSPDYVVSVDPSTGVTDTYLDTNADGALDTDIIDVTGDSIPDVMLQDTDGDGQLDSETVLNPDLEQQGDSTADPAEDPTQSPLQTDPTADPNAHNPFPSQPGLDPNVVADPTAQDPAVTDPNVADPTAQPDTSDYTIQDRLNWEGQFWQQQTANGFCAPTSVAILVSELTGQHLDASQFVQRAIDLGLLTKGGQFDGWSGVTVQGTEQLIESFGIPAETLTPATSEEAWSDMQSLLDRNFGIVAFVDSSEIWQGPDDPATDNTPMDHAVTIAAYDDKFVYLNDPGTPNGELEAVPREQFEQAWRDSGYSMVVPDTQGPTAAAEATGTTATGAEPGLTFTGQMPNYFQGEQDFLSDVVAKQAGIALLAVVIPASAVTVIARTAIQEAHKN